MQTFWTHGYAGTKLPMLLAELGIARQSLYNTFGDKRSLLLKALKRYSDAKLAHHRKRLAGKAPLEDLIQFVHGWRHRRRRTQGRGCLMCLMMGEFGSEDAEVALRVSEHTQRMVKLFEDTLRRAEVEDEVAKLTAAGLVATSFGIAHLSRQPGSQALVNAVTDDAVQRLRALRS